MAGVRRRCAPLWAILVSAIDNLAKASGRAIQNIKVLRGLSETTGLEHRALFP